MKKLAEKIDNVSNGILYGLIFGAMIFAITGNSIFFALIGPGAFLGLLLDLSTGRIKSNYPIGIFIGLIFGLSFGLILFGATGHAYWFALAAPGAIFGLFYDPTIRITRQEH